MKSPVFAIVAAVAVTVTLFCGAKAEANESSHKSTSPLENKPHNIIYLIGDGMGPAHVSAYRYYKASKTQLATGDKGRIAITEFDKYLVGMASTYPADDTLVTDSAAGATALSTGFKSYNGAIGVTPDQHHQETLLERAKEQGWVTGVVSTSQINHATPASFIAHIDSRRKYDDIADQYLEERIKQSLKADIMLGGGTRYFRRDDRDLVAEFEKLGVDYIDDINHLDRLDSLPALGLFAKKGLAFEIDHQGQPYRLAQMTQTSLDLASAQSKPFFLMIEGSQIDWCSHANDIACSMKEMEDFEQTLIKVIDFAKQHGNTTVVMTADHSTGGLTMGRDGDYEWLADKVHLIRISGEEYTMQVKAGSDPVNNWKEHVDLPLTKEEQKLLVGATKAEDWKSLHQLFVSFTSEKTATGWTTTGHTAIDVQVFAFGPDASQFIGFQDNTDIAKKLFKLMSK